MNALCRKEHCKIKVVSFISTKVNEYADSGYFLNISTNEGGKVLLYLSNPSFR